MFLKKLTLKGFKTFAEKTVLELDGKAGIFCIVGPNGCGKSNIVDAIRWVVGEQSVRELRGGKLEEIIFAGTAERPPLSLAEVTLLLDNADRRLRSDFSEVEVKRRVYRSSESEFFLNQQACRLKHLRDLFFDTGLGGEAYAIIRQGQVDMILNAKPEERRALFEEAAQIQQYRHRRMETERKLIATEQNILRLTDLKHELTHQCEILKQQSVEARRFNELKATLKQLDLALVRQQVGVLLEKREGLKMQGEGVASEREGLVKHLQHKRIEKERVVARHHEVTQASSRMVEKLHTLQTEIAAEKAEGEIARERLTLTAAQLSQVFVEREELTQFRGATEQKQAEDREALRELKAAKREAEAAIAAQEAIYLDWQRTVEAQQGKLQDLKDKLFELERALSYATKGLTEQRLHVSQQEGETHQLGERCKEKEQALAQLIARQTQWEKHYETLTHEQQEKEQALAASAIEKKSCEAKVMDNAQALLAQKAALERIKSRLELLKELSRNFEGLEEGVSCILQLKEKAEHPHARDIVGVVAELLQFPESYRLALEVALGERAQWIVVENREAAFAFMDYLSQEQRGYGTFLVLSECAPGVGRPEVTVPPQALGTASQLVQYPEYVARAMQPLLTNIWLFPDRLAMQTYCEEVPVIPKGLLLVSLDGTVVKGDGYYKGGGKGEQQIPLLGRGQEIEALTSQLLALKEGVTAGEVLLEKAREQLERVEERYQQALSDYQTVCLRGSEVRLAGEQQEAERAQLDREIKGMQDVMAHRHETYQLLTREIEAETEKISAMEREGVSLREAILAEESVWFTEQRSRELAAQQLLEKRVTLGQLVANYEARERAHQVHCQEQTSFLGTLQRNYEDEQQLARRYQELVADEETARLQLPYREHEHIALQEGRVQLSEEEEALRADLAKIEVMLILTQDSLSSLETRIGKEAVKQEKVALEIENMRDRVQVEYGLDLAAILEGEVGEKLRDVDVTRGKQRLAEMREELAAIGAVNLLAIREYEEGIARLKTLEEQLMDLDESRGKLSLALLELDEKAKVSFLETLAVVNQHFSEIFGWLFEGGEAKLMLTTEENVLEAGVEIVARPGGKKWLPLSLLSGGEKSLTALALLFALLRTHPSPFCLLDEVDAALDEANVQRFIGLLQRFANDVQFIVVTHSKQTMAAANALYGVTMEEAGVSKLIPFKFDAQPVAIQVA